MTYRDTVKVEGLGMAFKRGDARWVPLYTAYVKLI